MVISAGPVSATESTTEDAPAAAAARSSAAPGIIAPPAAARAMSEGNSTASTEPAISGTTGEEGDSSDVDSADPLATATGQVDAGSTDTAHPSGTAESVEASAAPEPTLTFDDSPATNVEPIEATAVAESTDAPASADTTEPEPAAAVAQPTIDAVPYVATISRLLHEMLHNIESYRGRVFAAHGKPQPLVDHYWVRPGEEVRTSCVEPDGTPAVAHEGTSAYCGADDVIYLGEEAARAYEREIGRFGSGVVLSHEYAHNIQQELGISDVEVRPIQEIELQADCLGGVWMNEARAAGLLDDNATGAIIRWASTIGDVAHGTGEQRVAAWTRGLNSGAPSACGIFVPTE